MGNKNDHVVIAIYSDEEAAKQAANALQNWDKANNDIKLGAIGTISKQGDKVKTHVGRKTGSGAKVGAVLGITAAVLSGGITLIPGVVGGAVGGGAIGTFFKKSLHLTKEEIQQLGQKLDSGRVALVVTVDENEVDATSKQLADSGGDVESYAVPTEALEEAAQSTDIPPSDIAPDETASTTPTA
jgi:uncharacterized membrane protein